MSPPAEIAIQDVHGQVETDTKAVDKQPTAVPNMTSAQKPAEKADRLRGGCIPCPVRSSFVFGLRFISEKCTYRVDAVAAFPYLAAAKEPLLYRGSSVLNHISQPCSPPSLYLINYSVSRTLALSGCTPLTLLVTYMYMIPRRLAPSLSRCPTFLIDWFPRNLRAKRFPNHTPYRQSSRWIFLVSHNKLLMPQSQDFV